MVLEPRTGNWVALKAHRSQFYHQMVKDQSQRSTSSSMKYSSLSGLPGFPVHPGFGMGVTTQSDPQVATRRTKPCIPQLTFPHTAGSQTIEREEKQRTFLPPEVKAQRKADLQKDGGLEEKRITSTSEKATQPMPKTPQQSEGSRKVETPKSKRKTGRHLGRKRSKRKGDQDAGYLAEGHEGVEDFRTRTYRYYAVSEDSMSDDEFDRRQAQRHAASNGAASPPWLPPLTFPANVVPESPKSSLELPSILGPLSEELPSPFAFSQERPSVNALYPARSIQGEGSSVLSTQERIGSKVLGKRQR